MWCRPGAALGEGGVPGTACREGPHSPGMESELTLAQRPLDTGAASTFNGGRCGVWGSLHVAQLCTGPVSSLTACPSVHPPSPLVLR